MMTQKDTPPHATATARRRRPGRPWLYRSGAVLIGCLVGLIIAEITLSIHDPFHLVIRGNRIDLPKNVRYRYRNHAGGRLDDTVVNYRNSIGFRGEEPPARFPETLTFITVGGSTTACTALSDGDTWPDRLLVNLRRDFDPVWLNNAGLEGHSTFGHLVLCDDYIGPMQPDVVIFLVGVNDVGNVVRDRLMRYDSETFALVPPEPNIFVRIVRSLAKHSHVCALADNLMRHMNAREHGLVNEDLGVRDYYPSPEVKVGPEFFGDVTEDLQEQVIAAHAATFLPGYAERYRHLIRMLKARNIVSVIVTQPVLYGAVDARTGIDFTRLKMFGVNGATQWKVVELYNDVSRKLAEEENVLLVDLARKLPKDTTYFYDHAHYTNDGAAAIADIVYDRLKPFVEETFPSFSKEDH